MSTWDDKPNDYEHAVAIIEQQRRIINRLRDVLIWTEENCPGRCQGPIRKTLIESREP